MCALTANENLWSLRYCEYWALRPMRQSGNFSPVMKRQKLLLKRRLPRTTPRPLTTRLLKFIKECVMAKLARWKMPKNLSKEFSAKIVTICPKSADSNLINDLENQWKAKRATAERFHWMML